MEIPLLVLILQIGFNAALNNRGYNINPVIPLPRFVNSIQTRRLAEADSDLQLSSRGLPDSDEQSDSGYSSSFEDYSYRSVRPLQIRPNQRSNNYLRYSPDGRINSNNQQERLQTTSPLTRRADPYLRRNGVSNLRPSQNSQNYRKVNDDSSLEVSSLESTNSEDSSRLGEEATYLRSLLSLMEHPNNRRGQNRKYYGQEISLSNDVSPIDKLDSHENNLPNPLNKRRYSDPDDYGDSILLVTDDEDKPNGLKRPSEQNTENYDQLRRRYNRMKNNNAGPESTLNDNAGKLTVLRLANLEDLNLDSPLLRNGNHRINNNRNYLRLSLSPDNKITLDEGVASELSEILSETLDELNLAPVNLRRPNITNNYNRRNNDWVNAEGNNLQISLDIPKSASPLRRYYDPANLSGKNILRTHGNHTREDPKKSLHEYTVKTLDPSLRTHGNHTRQVLKKISPRRYRGEGTNHSNKTILRTHGNHTRQVLKELLDEDTAKTLNPSLRTHGNHTREGPKIELDEDTVKARKPSLRTQKNHTRQVLKKLHEEDTAKTLEPILRTHGNHTRHELKKFFDEDTAKTPVPYHEGKGTNTKNKHTNNNEKDDGWPDEYSLDTLFDFRKEGNLTDDLKNRDNLGSELKSSDENVPKDDAVLHLEYPWNGALSLSGYKNKSQLNTDEDKDKTKDGSDTLQLEFPWNGQLSLGDKDKPQQKNDDEKENTTDNLELEFPWNDALTPNSDKGDKQFSSEDNTKDTLHLEYPWNDQVSPDKNKTILRSDTDRQDKEPKDDLKLEFPSSDQKSREKPSSQKTLRIPDPFYIHPYLRNRNINKHPNYFRRAYDEFSKGLRLMPENLKNRRYDSYRRRPARRRYDDLEVIGLSRSSEEDPSDVITFPSDRKQNF